MQRSAQGKHPVHGSHSHDNRHIINTAFCAAASRNRVASRLLEELGRLTVGKRGQAQAFFGSHGHLHYL